MTPTRIETPTEVATRALDTLLALLAHRRICRQCRLDDSFCSTARTYEKNFMGEVRRYQRAQGEQRNHDHNE